jgi:hypothetical protein
VVRWICSRIQPTAAADRACLGLEAYTTDLTLVLQPPFDLTPRHCTHAPAYTSQQPDREESLPPQLFMGPRREHGPRRQGKGKGEDSGKALRQRVEDLMTRALEQQARQTRIYCQLKVSHERYFLCSGPPGLLRRPPDSGRRWRCTNRLWR